MYKLDDISYYFGIFEWDAYLISRGVRLLGDHHFHIDDYQKIKSQIKEAVEKHGVKMLVKYHKTKGKVKMAEIVIYHSKKGQTSLNRLKELEERRVKAQNNPLYASIEKKIIEGGELVEEERRFQRKLRKENDLLEVEYGKLYGYDKSSIKKHMDKIYKDRQESFFFGDPRPSATEPDYFKPS